MAVTKTQSPLMRRLGKRLDDAVRNAAGKAPVVGNQPLPPGITDGIARLDDIEFKQVAPGKANAGEFYCRMVATVVEPEFIETPNGSKVQVAGRKTSLLIMLCDTKNKKGEVTTLNENIETLEAHMKLMGVPAEHFDGGGEALESAAQMLREAKPYIIFSTSSGKPSKEYPTPRTFENWYGSQGIPDDYQPPQEAGGAVHDDTGGGDAGVDPSNADGAYDQPDDQTDDQPDLDALAEAADRTKVVKGKQVDDGDQEAKDQLEALAAQYGVGDEAANANSWAEVVELIRGAMEAQSGDDQPDNEPPADEPVVWTKGDVAVYAAPDPKNAKKKLKPSQHEVTSANKLKRVADLKALAGGKVYKAVSWDELEPVKE